MLKEIELPQYTELTMLEETEQLALMPLSKSSDSHGAELFILRCFAYTVENKGSDIHFSEYIENGEILAKASIRTPKGFVVASFGRDKNNYVISRLKGLAGIAGSGLSSPITSARFSMDFPVDWAQGIGLGVAQGAYSYLCDIRVQYQKTYNGVTVVCRILDQQRAPKLHQIGLSDSLMYEMKEILNNPSGLVLASGPTGSGKTTLLNAMLDYLNDGTKSIFTIENPVEFRLQGKGSITQAQVSGEMTFAACLRSALRADPDIILIGEIRDSETMEIALQAAQTGHLVLSTIHANGAIETIGRILDLTLDKERDAFRVADTLKLVMAQRLVDKYELEPSVRSITQNERDYLEDNGIAIPRLITESSSKTKAGKVAVIEAMLVDTPIKRVIKAPTFDSEQVFKIACNQLQYETLPQAGFRAAEAGVVRISDCQTNLDANIYASSHKTLRTQYAEQFGLTYTEVNEAINRFYRSKENREERDLYDILLEMQQHSQGNPLTTAKANSAGLRVVV